VFAVAAAAACGDVGREVQLSCGEHTDYGLLTLVNQDAHVSALQVEPLCCAMLCDVCCGSAVSNLATYCAVSEVQLSYEEHTDYGILTLVNQEAHVSALQVLPVGPLCRDVPCCSKCRLPSIVCFVCCACAVAADLEAAVMCCDVL
jgi:isopenicillin N synthase-like dioxygenase